jgi:hypothetical protein
MPRRSKASATCRNSSDGSMGHPPGDVAADFRFVPLRMIAAQSFPHNLLGERPQAKSDREALRGSFPPQDRGQGVVEDIIGEAGGCRDSLPRCCLLCLPMWRRCRHAVTSLPSEGLVPNPILHDRHGEGNQMI